MVNPKSMTKLPKNVLTTPPVIRQFVQVAAITTRCSVGAGRWADLPAIGFEALLRAGDACKVGRLVLDAAFEAAMT